MTLPIRDYLAGTAVAGALAKARVMRSFVLAKKQAFETGSVSANEVIAVLQGLKEGRDVLASYAAVSGVDAVAKNEFNDANLSLSTELNSIVSACDACITWITNNFPKDANGYIIKDKIVNGWLETRTLTTAQTAGLVAQLDLLLAKFSA